MGYGAGEDEAQWKRTVPTVSAPATISILNGEERT